MQNLTNGMELDSIIFVQPFTIKTFVVSKGEATFSEEVGGWGWQLAYTSLGMASETVYAKEISNGQKIPFRHQLWSLHFTQGIESFTTFQ